MMEKNEGDFVIIPGSLDQRWNLEGRGLRSAMGVAVGLWPSGSSRQFELLKRFHARPYFSTL